MKLYVYSHECGHQFEGPDETKADLFAIGRGVKRGWLDAVGMEEICTFISTVKGDSVHPPGPVRCETMRKHYARLIKGGNNGFAKTSDGAPVDAAKYQETRARMMEFAKKAAQDEQTNQQALAFRTAHSDLHLPRCLLRKVPFDEAVGG